MQTCSKLDLPTLSLIHHLHYPKKTVSNNIIFVLDSKWQQQCCLILPIIFGPRSGVTKPEYDFIIGRFYLIKKIH